MSGIQNDLFKVTWAIAATDFVNLSAWLLLLWHFILDREIIFKFDFVIQSFNHPYYLPVIYKYNKHRSVSARVPVVNRRQLRWFRRL